MTYLSPVSTRMTLKFLAAAGAALVATSVIAAPELPTGGRVESGSATFTQSQSTLNVRQATQRLQLGWDSFNVGQGAAVNFQQPSSSALAVNLVRGGDASVIAGTINANGRVVLVNPQGIAFTGTAQVNVGSLVASALRDATGDFSDGRTTLSGPGGEVSNAGSITVANGGHVVLSGSRVTNSGLILADAGKASLAAGSRVALDFAGDGLLKLAVEAGAVDAAVTNGGVVRVGSGQVLMTAKAADGLADSVVRNSGFVSANAVVERGGEIWITADAVESSGTVSASSAQGQGGSAHLVGGKSVSVTGTVNVTGAAQGGFVDVSAPAVLLPDIFQIKVGRGGTFLLDPDNITIDNAGSPIVGDPTNSSPATDITLSRFSIENWLSTGANLVVDAVGNITVQAPISVGAAGAGALTLDAGGNIDVQQPINTTGSLTLIAGGSIDISAPLAAAAIGVDALGDLTVSADILTTVGDLDFQVGGDLILDSSALLFGNLTFESAADITSVIGGNVITNVPLVLGGTYFELYTNAGADLYAAGWVIAEDAAASEFNLAGDVSMQYGFKSGFAMPTATDLAFVPEGQVKYPDPYVNQAGIVTGLVRGDALAEVFDAPNLALTWTGAAPTAAAAAGSTFGYSLSLGAGFSINSPGYILFAAQNTGTLTVRPRELLVKPDDRSGTYGSATVPAKYLYQITGFQFADTNTTLGITGEAVTGCDYNPADPLKRGAGDYAITITQGTLAKSGAASANYQFNLIDGNYAIAKARLNILADDKSRVYGDANPALTHTVVTSDLRYSDTVGSVFTGSPALSTAADPLSDVGAYDIDANVGTLVNVSPNYDIVLTDGVLTVTKAPLAVTAADDTRTYGAADPAFTYTFTGFKNGEDALTAGISGIAATTTTALVTSPVGDYTINVSNGTLQAANYDFTSFLPGTLTVTKAPLTVAAQNATREYGLPNSEVTFTYVITGLLNGDPVSVVTGSPSLSTAATQLSDVGTYAITVDAGTLTSANYDIGFLSSGSLTITPATSLVITANNQRRLYGDANPSLTGQYTITGFRNDDTVVSSGISGLAAVTYNPAVTTTSNVGAHGISIALGTLVDGAATNYDLAAATYVPGVLTIEKAPLSVVADSKSRIYGDANPLLTYTLAGFKNGETQAGLTTAGALAGSPVVATSATQQSNAGTYDITVGLGTLSATNYEFTPLTKGTLTIQKRALTVTAKPQTRDYASADQYALGSEDSYTITGFLFSQTSAGLRLSGDLSGSPAMTTNAILTSNVGSGYSVNIAKGTLSATNYSFDTSTFVGAGYVITKAPITVTASDKTRLYGDANPALEYTLSGFKLGEATLGAIGATGLPTVSTAVTALTDVGVYPVTVSVDDMSAQNYRFVAANGSLTINKAPLSLAVDSVSSEYGSAFSGFTLTMTGFKNGQTQAGLRTSGALSGDATYTYTNAQVAALHVAGSPYTVDVTGVGSLLATNYSFTLPATGGTLTITKAPITLAAANVTKVYGEAVSQATLDGSWIVVGLKNGETRDGLLGSGAFSGAPVVTSTRAPDATTPAGAYAGEIGIVNGTFAVSPLADYSFDGASVPAGGTLTVNKAIITVGVQDTPLSRLYGAANPAFAATYSGWVNGESFASAGVTGAPSFSTGATNASNVGSYAINVDTSGLSAANYSFIGQSGTLDVTKAPLTVTADPKSREYGLSNPAFTATVTGFVLGQNLGSSGVAGSAALATTATPTSGIGTYPITAGLGSLTSSNYSFSFVDSTLTITRAPLTITADSKTKVYGDANPALTYSVVGLRQGDTESVISGAIPALQTTVDVLTGAGTYAGAITVGDVSGLSADNYTIGRASGNLTVNKATLVGTVDDASRYYGFPNPAFTVTWTGYKNGDTAATSGFTGAIAFSTVANPASPFAGSPYTVSATPGTYSSPNYTFGAITPGILTVERGNLWENEVYNLAAAPLAAALRLGEIEARLRGQPLVADPQARINFDRYPFRLELAPPKRDEKRKDDEAAKEAPKTVSKN